jgi:hypothetical protein
MFIEIRGAGANKNLTNLKNQTVKLFRYCPFKNHFSCDVL